VPLRPLRPGKTGVPTLTLSTPSSQLRRWVHYIETIAAFLVAVGTNTLITVAAAVTTVHLNGFTISCVFFSDFTPTPVFIVARSVDLATAVPVIFCTCYNSIQFIYRY